MRIAVWHNLPSGGGKRALHYHIRGLVERGHEVESWCPPTADQNYLPLKDLVPEHVVPATAKAAIAGRSLSRFITPYMADALNKIKTMDEYCRESAEEINRGDFDLLFANSSLDIAASSIGRYVRIPKVLYLQEPFRWLYEANPYLPWVALPTAGNLWWAPGFLREFLHNTVRVRGWRIQALEEWQNAKAFDAILVNSFFSRETILRTYGLEAKVCYLGVDTQKFIYQHLPRENFVVGIGSIIPLKNVKFVVQAIGQVKEPRPKLIWIGNACYPPYVQELRDLAEASKVDFEPQIMVDDNELVELLNRALAMVYAPRLEPFGFAPLEANACGLPVVAVAEGGVRETVIDRVNGLLVENDPGAMAVAVQSLIDDKAFARKLGGNGRELVEERWTLTGAIDRLEGRFKDVL